jgi:thioredoxin 2
MVVRCRGCGALNNYGGARAGKVARCGTCRGALDVSGKPQGVREDELHRAVEGSPVPVVVLVCDPADPAGRIAAGVLERVATRHLGELVALTVDVEVHPRFAGEHAIDALPAFLLYRKQEEAARLGAIAVASADELERWVLSPPTVH